MLAAITIVAGLAFWTWTDFTDVRRDAEAKVSNAALAIDQLAGRSLLAIDVVLESVVARLAEQGLDKLGSEPEREHLGRIASRLPETGALFIADKVGSVIAGTVSYPSGANVSDREWFRVLQNGKADLHIGRALKGRGVHNFFFPVARSIRSANGTFIGVAQVGLEATYIAELFSSLDVGIGAHLGLYETQEGAVVARYPMTEALLDETIATLPFFAALVKSQTQSWTGWIRNHDREELVSARRLKDWPLIVSASSPKRAIYSAAWTRLLWGSVIATITIAALLLLTTLAARQARREATLTRELEHRVKNMLGVVVTVIERARDDTASKEEFVSSLRARIRSMAGAQALLSQSSWRGVSLADLVRAELEPYDTGSNSRLAGPAVYLAPDAMHGLAMVMHELTTNAAKYGALSQPGGKVTVRWTAEGPPAATLKIEWEETGGPEVAVPARQGYGSSLIRDLLAYELGGRVDLVIASDGVRCMIELPASFIAETPG